MTDSPTAPRNGIPWRLLGACLLSTLLAYGQSVDGSLQQSPSSLEALPSEMRLAQNLRGNGSANMLGEASAAANPARTQAFRQSATHLRAGRRHLEGGDFLSARVAFDAAVEALIGESAIDFSSDTEAREVLEKLIQDIHRLEATRMDLADPSEAPVYQQSPLDQIPELTFPIDPSLKATVLDQILSRSGEFPLEVNDTVLSYVRYFTSERGSRTFVAGHRRSGRYRDMILRILDEEGLPRELIHLAQAESGFQPRAVSWAAAGGLWQFIGSRGQEYGLGQSALTDDRFDPEKATRAAARHLRDLYKQFGDWNLAMAAYNCGPMCVERAVERTGYADFWELRRLNVIPKETTNYVPIVQALAIISLNPAAYGIELPEMDPPLRFDTHTLEAKTNLNLVADLLGITKAEVRELNPAVKGDLAPQGYPLRVPKQTVPTLLAGLSQVPAEKRVAWRAHRVSEGDTLPAIAKQFKVTPAKIAEANALAEGASTEGNDLAGAMQTGDLLLIPATYSAPVVKRTVRKSTRKAATRKRATTKKATPTKRTAAAKRHASAKKPARLSGKSSTRKAQTTARKIVKPTMRPRAANAGAGKAAFSRG